MQPVHHAGTRREEERTAGGGGGLPLQLPRSWDGSDGVPIAHSLLLSCACAHAWVQLMVPIKHEIHTLLALVDPLRMWVSLNIPKIQDQKGMAVSVKEGQEKRRRTCVGDAGRREMRCAGFGTEGGAVCARRLQQRRRSHRDSIHGCSCARAPSSLFPFPAPRPPQTSLRCFTAARFLPWV